MKKIVRIGAVEVYNGRYANVFCKIEYKDKKLSISGVVGPTRDGNCYGSCGQIYDELEEIKEYAPGWTRGMTEGFIEVWKRWHLNDMRAGCEHQRSWPIERKITLNNYSWSDKYHHARKQAESGKMSVDEYGSFRIWSKEVLAATIGTNTPKYESEEIKMLLGDGWIKLKNTEEKTAGLVHFKEHPEGLLSKECPVCGYKYGSAWLHEDVPGDVIEWLESLPDTDITPAWV